ncbi:glycosyltransferase [Wukongibacter sp. M2B1]|uniref:glycosyltransferase n=1 Tax=Wukongibacter sp. M2B1 TaxID=3088895 RepID=UPI003D790AA1
MSDKKKIVVDIEFNSRATKCRATKLSRTKEWIDYRMGIFHKFTLQSLKKQTNQDFLVLIRYDKITKNLIKSALSRYEALPSNVKFLISEDYENTLKQNIIGYDYLYLVQLDCDDMYHKTFIQQLHDYKPKNDTEVLINQNGYVYDSINNRLGNWYYLSPPFYTTVNRVKDYLEGKRIPIGSHHAIAIKYNNEKINGCNYVVVIHDKNTMNKFNSHRVGDVITDAEEIRNILKHFM